MRQSKLELEIVEYFNTHHENGTGTIAKHFGIDYDTCSYYIEKYLSTKKGYSGNFMYKIDKE
jgi:hypothetical protein